ncbi:hypothetical protein [Archangium sp.]|uniref:hypothetical protein n=1 Tax=Archangium sp. TaxID=1872627 RepID=UPI002D4A3591|nr:hypothetical protein [Archangium sp.]HYO54295.1 hypothetical protein [Archangium sp.]
MVSLHEGHFTFLEGCFSPESQKRIGNQFLGFPRVRALRGAAALRGWVQDVRGMPVAARVLAFEARPAETQEGLARHVAAEALEAPARATATTGPDGDFLLRLPEGHYHLLAEVGGRPAALALDVQPGPSEVRLVVTDGERLKGQVVDAEGSVARARVTVVGLAPVRRLREVESDETGAFEVDGLLPQARYGVWARAPAHGQRVLLVPASRPGGGVGRGGGARHAGAARGRHAVGPGLGTRPAARGEVRPPDARRGGGGARVESGADAGGPRG